MFVLLPRLLAAIVLASQIGLAHSTPQRPQERKQADHPVTIVIRAEALMQKGEKEDAALMLWRALDLLRGKKLGPIEEATRLSARFLLQENDNLELQRRAAFTHVATLQTQLARSYRLKKWYDTARDHKLDINKWKKIV